MSVTPTARPSSAHIRNPRLLRASKILWIILTLVTLITWIGTRPIFFEQTRTPCTVSNCPLFSQLTAEEKEALQSLSISVELYGTYIDLTNVLILLTFVGIGLFLFWQAGDNWMVLLMSFMAMVSGVTLGGGGGLSGYQPQFIAIFPPVWHSLLLLNNFLFGLLFVLIFLIFPNGLFVPSWTRWLMVISFASQVLAVFYADIPYIENETIGAVWYTSWVVILAYAQIYRYRQVSDATQRQQTKWIVLISIITFIEILFVIAIETAFPVVDQPGIPHLIFFHVVERLFLICQVILFSIGFGVAVLRYRLWDIDLLVNRSLVYGTMTGLALGVFFVTLLILQVIVGNTQPVVAGIIALGVTGVAFNPSRKGIQHFVDRSIYHLNFDLNQLTAAQRLPEIEHPGALSGRKLGGYEVLDVIGKGGMGEVYKGQGNGQTVALKILPDDLAREEQFRQRFEREGQALTALHHPNIVKMITSGANDGIAFLVMEYLEGEELSRKLNREGALPLDETLDILKGLTAALDYAHGQGMVHRDIKPSNVMLRRSKDGETLEGVLMDFGVAKIREAQSGLTGTGAIGTIDYMAPEQIMSAREVDQRADIYALGVMVYEMLTGEQPFKGSAAQIMFAHLQQPPPNPRDVKDDVPREAARAVMRAMAKNPEERFATAGEFAAAL
jgi:tRNA A-37 threonylcarbamoyl transferase component Bud32